VGQQGSAPERALDGTATALDVVLEVSPAHPVVVVGVQLPHHERHVAEGKGEVEKGRAGGMVRV